MHLNPFYPKRSLLLLTACLLLPALTARSDEPTLRELLRDGLYTEEVTRDPEAAAKQYEQLLARYSEQRDFAASALFRLAEVRRKQDRKEDAVKLYQRLLTEFPGAANETKLARENLAALGGRPAESTPIQGDAESQELARLQAAAKSSPDVLLDPHSMWNALSNDMPAVVKFLLASGGRPYDVEDALPLAVQKGNLEITRLLLEKGGEVPPELVRKAIISAIDYKRPTILEFLLEKGLRPAATVEGSMPLLAQALVQDQYQAAEILLKYRADPDEMVAPNPSDYLSGGTPLHFCIQRGEFDAAAWLLEKGAKPDIATPRFGLTPLHLAALSDKPGMLAIMEKLLAAGADPNHVSERDTFSDNNQRQALNATPLESAISAQMLNVEKVELLLKHGGKTDRKDSKAGSRLAIVIRAKDSNFIKLTTILGEAGMSMKPPEIIRAAAAKGGAELVSLVLKYGADPNATDENGSSILATACGKGDIAMAKAFLDAGADPKKLTRGGDDLLRTAAQGSSVEILKLLADAGLAPAPDWKANRYSGASHEAVGFLLDHFVLPELTVGAGAHFVMDLFSGVETVLIWDPVTNKKPPVLESWLLSRASQIQFLFGAGGMAEYQWRIYRRDTDGTLIQVPLDLSGKEPFPELQSGDVVLCRTTVENWKSRDFGQMPPAMRWDLQKRIAFPVTVTIAGKSREVSVRGDRLFFDPTKPEVPLVDAQQVMDFIWQPDDYAVSIPVTIVVKRKGWPEVRMGYGSKEAGTFQLEPADELTLVLPPNAAAEFEKRRPLSVALKAVGVAFTRSFGEPEDRKAIPETLPTLIQALMETQVPFPFTDEWKEWGVAAAAGKVDLATAGRVFRGFEILPHPDLSRIRIRRLAEDGKETVLEIDLAAAMTPDITPEAARKVDVILQGGDIVEIPLKDTAGPWKGFTEDEKRFFAKALAGKVQFVDGDGKISFTEINCRPPDFIETASGWLPVPAPIGSPGARASWVLGNVDGEFRRGDLKRRPNSSTVFLRDGDEWKSSGGSGQRQVRPRVVPPPQPGSSNSLPPAIR